LDDEETNEMESLVALKLGEMKTRILAWDPDDYTLATMKERGGWPLRNRHLDLLYQSMPVRGS